MGTRLEILQAACRKFEQALATTNTLAEAEALRARSCRELEQSCKSEMLRLLLDEHAKVHVRARFDRPPSQEQR